eukprot:13060768-Ditylum_brightwellii.AAC.1
MVFLLKPTKFSDVPAERINEVMCRNDKVAFFVSRGHAHVSKHADPGGGTAAILYGDTTRFVFPGINYVAALSALGDYLLFQHGRSAARRNEETK